jgi:arylsulfatase A-like enzyme
MPTTGGLRLASFGRRHATTFSVTALVALMAAGCSPQQPTQVPAYELGDNLRFAHISRETAAIDVGSADDESHLLFGWSHREGEARSGRTFRWGLEPHSELSFTVVEPRTVTLRLEGRPHKGRSRRATVTVELNEEPVGRLELRPGPQSYALPLAEELLRRGVNRLRLRYGLDDADNRPADEQRDIAVAWSRLTFEGIREPATEPRLEKARGLLFIPFGSQVDFYLRAPVGAVLRSVRRRFVGGDGTLAVHLQSDDVLEQRLASLTGEGELEITLPVGPSEPIRLSLAAIPAGPGGEGAGVALDLPTIWSDAPTEIVRPAPRVAREIVDRPNVIIYLVDTLRADHLGCYGHQRGVSPRIDRFAEGATLFENTRAQAPWTLPSVASVMTGLWPPSHGVFEDTRRLAPEAVTLAEVLRDAGYQTAAVVTNGFATGAYGLDQGFDELTLIKTGHRKSHLVHRAAVAWLEDRDPERPFFLYLHTIDPHKPYLPTQELRQRFAPEAEEIWREIVANPRRQRWPPTDPVVAQLRALYDAEIAENDASFGDTLDALASAGLYDDALIVFLSDHGEEFHEHHSWTHAADLFREVLNVPLIVKLPRQRHGHRVSALAQQIDLMPTLLTYLGIPGPPTQGRLLPTLLGPDEPTPVDSQRVFSHTKRKNQTTASIIDSAWKYIRRVDSKGVTSRLYNWHDDPHELNDRTADYPVLANLLAVEIQRQLAASTPPGAAEATPDEEVLDNLRALGYVD